MPVLLCPLQAALPSLCSLLATCASPSASLTHPTAAAPRHALLAPREIVQRRPHEFKIACLEDIRALFPPDWNPFYAGFGNRDTDVVSYREVGVPPSRTFIINPKGQICKGSSVLQSSTWSSLSAINALVDEVFPAVQVRWGPGTGGARGAGQLL